MLSLLEVNALAANLDMNVNKTATQTADKGSDSSGDLGPVKTSR